MIASSEKLKKSRKVDVSFVFGGKKSDPVTLYHSDGRDVKPSEPFKFYFHLGEGAGGSSVPPDRKLTLCLTREGCEGEVKDAGSCEFRVKHTDIDQEVTESVTDRYHKVRSRPCDFYPH